MFQWWILRSIGKMEISGAIAYFLLLGAALAVAVGLYFGLRAIKLI
jgi:hypothetical protein